MPVLSDNQRGAFFMTCAMLAFLVNDTFMKALSDELPLMQALLLRGLGTLAALVVWMAATRTLTFTMSRRDWGLTVLRTCGEVGGAYFFLTALFHMPMANAQSILQALPLAVTLAAALFLGEPVGWRRFTAIGIGLLGVMLIIRPGPDGFNIYSIYALISVASVVVRDLATRRLSRAAPSMTVALAAGIGVTLFGATGTLASEWVPVSAKVAWQLLGAISFVVLGYLASILTMRTGEIGFVSPFRYTGLVFALISGLLVFGEWPDPVTLLGAAIVVATGIFTLIRESRVKPSEIRVPDRIRG
jgi:S-adenosylmethionine uptake transporter